MTRTPAPALSPAEAARVAAFDAAPVPPECDPERVETVARALARHEPQYHDGYLTGEPDFFSCGADDDTGRGCEWVSDPESEDDYATQHRRHLAAAAIAADPSPAEEAVKRVEALVDKLVDEARNAAEGSDPELAHPYLNAAGWLRAALASPAPAPQGEEPTCYCGRLGHRLGGPVLHKRTEECAR